MYGVVYEKAMYFLWPLLAGGGPTLLEGSLKLVTHNWAYNPTYIPLNDLTGITQIISRVISPVVSSY